MRSKGQIRIIEALIMLAITFSVFLVATELNRPAGQAAERGIERLEEIGLLALKFLDQEGLLDRVVVTERWGVFKVGLESILPADVGFIAVFYNVTLTSNLTTSLVKISPTIRSAGHVNPEKAREVATIEYLFAPVYEGSPPSLRLVLVRLTLVRGGEIG